MSSFDESMKEGVDAVFSAAIDKKTVGSVLERSLSPLGTKGEVATWADDGAVIAFYPGAVRRMSHKSPIVIAQLTTLADGRIGLRTFVQRGLSSQSKSMGIKTGPKRLVGVNVYRKFLNFLEGEIYAADPAAQVTRRGSKAMVDGAD